MYTIKQIPEDFVVKEWMELTLGEGPYAYYVLKKRDYTTAAAIKKISAALQIDVKYINSAGNKDRRAVTEQYISINKGPKKNLDLHDVSLTFIGKGEERIALGDLKGNEFVITVRNLADEDIAVVKENKKTMNCIPNYFDEQRFGTNKNNHLVGKALIQKDFKKACSMVEETSSYLETHPTDFVGALKTIDKRIVRLYVHAYQSYLWNNTVERYLKEIKSDYAGSIPLVGFSTEIEGKAVKEIIEKLLEEEAIQERDFIIRAIPELSSEGGQRDLFVEVKDFAIKEITDDELNNGKKKMVLSFYLPKGCYATTVIKFLFSALSSQ